MPRTKVYRSLFDSDDVFEVEELTDTTETESKKIKQDEGEITNKQIWDLLCEMRDTLCAKPVTDNEPAENNSVSPVKQEIDKEEPVTTNDEYESEKVENEEEASREVKDTYSKFANNLVNKDSGGVSTQVAFQNRYAKVANK